MVHPRHLNTMKRFLTSLVFASLAGAAMAGVAETRPKQVYSHLWNNSPFTERKQELPKPVSNPLEHYALAGVAPVPGGYRITLLDRRNPGARMVLADRSEFSLLSVDYSPQHPLDTKVHLSLNGQQGFVTFDENLLKLTNPPAPAAPNAPAVGQPNETGARQPRPRVANPPAPNGNRPH